MTKIVLDACVLVPIGGTLNCVLTILLTYR